MAGQAILVRARLDADHAAAADSGGGTLHRIELNLGIVGIKKTVELRTAGIHQFRHLVFVDVPRLHLFLNLPDNDPLGSRVLSIVMEPVFLQKIVER